MQINDDHTRFVEHLLVVVNYEDHPKCCHGFHNFGQVKALDNCFDHSSEKNYSNKFVENRASFVVQFHNIEVTVVKIVAVEVEKDTDNHCCTSQALVVELILVEKFHSTETNKGSN